jgi:agmatine/peptidylarginine deiminase
MAGLVLMSACGVPEDDVARRTLERLLPGSTVVPVRCEKLAREGGALNCVTWTVQTAGSGKLA